MPREFPSTSDERFDRIQEETRHAYANLLLHVHDPWTEHCFACDTQGPCPQLGHWLDRLAALERADEELSRAEEPPTAGPPTDDPRADNPHPHHPAGGDLR